MCIIGKTREAPRQVFRLLVYSYILLAKREGRTGRISARGLDSTDRAQQAGSVQKRPRADILPVRSRASLVIRDL